MSMVTKHACGLHCLQVNDLAVTIGGKRIVGGVDLHAHCGELTAIIGRNGAGKSTVMKALVGEHRHTGTVRFSGHGGAPTPKTPRFGYVPQTLSVDKNAPVTVRDMVVCFTSRWPVFLPRRRRTIEALTAHLKEFGADGLMDALVGELSGGELQRVLLALATWQKPDVVLLDEPVSGVDSEGLETFYRMIDRLREQDLIVVMISHDLAFVREHADRVVLLEGGTVVASGTPQAVFSTDAFAAAFPVEAKKEANR